MGNAGTTTPAPTPQQAAAKARQANLAARAAVLLNSTQMVQRLFSTSLNPTAQNVLNIAPRNVGLITGFIIHVQASFTTGNTGIATRTQFGPANLLSRIMFQDVNNYTRTNTTGYHLSMLNSARLGFGYGGAYNPNLPINYGNNFPVMVTPATIPISTTDSTTSYYYYLPLAYSADDLSGAIYAGVINATMNLQLTINQNPVINAGDPLNAVFSGNNAANGGWAAGNSCTVTVYQVYLDQLPEVNGVPVLPPLDLATVYAAQYQALPGLVVGQDFPIPYANFRNFLSTFLIYDNAGVFNVGTDVNYVALQAANTTFTLNADPITTALLARPTFMADPPNGVYYLDTRRSPINTQQFGNFQAVVNPSAVTAGASVIACWEMLYNVNQITGAGSLANT